jgi:hypothetical protein
MSLKLWKHNHDCQIAEDHTFLYCVAFAAWQKPGLFYVERGVTWLGNIPAPVIALLGIYVFSTLEDNCLQCSTKKFLSIISRSRNVVTTSVVRGGFS